MFNNTKNAIEKITVGARRTLLTLRLSVHLIYLAYLIYAITADIGVMWINSLMATATIAFIIAYIILYESGRGAKKKMKATKRFYKRFKLLARLFSVISAVYSIISAADAVSPLAVISASLAAFLWIAQFLAEIIISALKNMKNRIFSNVKKDVKNLKNFFKNAKISLKKPDFSENFEEKDEISKN